MKISPFVKALAVMTAASLSFILSLAVFHSVLLVVIVYYITIGLVVPAVDGLVFQGRCLKDFAEYLGLNKANLKTSLGVGFGHGILFFTGTVAGYLLYKDALPLNLQPILHAWGIAERHQWMLAGFMILFNGIIEEIFWRGYALETVRNHWRPWVAVLVVTVFYTSYHLVTLLNLFKYSPVGLVIIAVIFGAGLTWGWMRISFNSIWASVIGHSFATLGYMLVFMWIS